MHRGNRRNARIASPLVAAAAAAGVGLLTLGSSGVAAAATSHESARQLLHAACSATLAASAFRAQGHVTTGGSTVELDVYFGSGGELLTLTQHGNQTFHAIQNGPATYIKGNGPFWRSTGGGGAASLLANRWIDMTSDKKDAASFTQEVSKSSVLSQCGGGSAATYAGTATLNGTKVTKIHQDSNHESNTYYVEAGPTHYIVKIAGDPSEKETGDLVFGSYGVQPDTTAPAGAIPISQFQ
jgi:hypothetical protein